MPTANPANIDAAPETHFNFGQYALNSYYQLTDE
jgi:hypothetical protein